jgi:hypothetical protein
MPTSSLKFRWLNRKGVLEAKSGSDVRQFLEIFGGPSAFSPVPTTLVRMFALGKTAGIRDLIFGLARLNFRFDAGAQSCASE